MLIYSVAAIISQTTNYALTLAGVTGIVVSIGITVDSYVIYFERLKDEVVHGRTLRNSAARGVQGDWRTILAANLVAFIAAAVLFVLSVGSVRGFALYLGVTTICDVIVLWFFTRPAVILLADTGRLDRRDAFGLGLVKAGRTLGGTPPLAPTDGPAMSADVGAVAPSGRLVGDDTVAAARSSARRRSTSGGGGGSGWRSRSCCWSITACHCGSVGLVLGIDFAGGVAWDVPAAQMTIEEAEAILEENGLSASSAKIQERRRTAATSSRCRSRTSRPRCGRRCRRRSPRQLGSASTRSASSRSAPAGVRRSPARRSSRWSCSWPSSPCTSRCASSGAWR